MKHLAVLNRFFFRYKWHFSAGLLFVALSTIFGTWQGIIIRKGTNRVTQLFINGGTFESSEFLRYGLTLIGLAVTSGVFMFLMRQTIIVMSRHIEFDQKNEIYTHYQQLDASFYKKHTTGDLMNRISEDVSKVRMYTGPAIMYLANTLVTTITVVGFMLQVNTKLTLLVFAPLPILSFLIYKVSDRISKQGAKVQEELGHLTTQAQESFSAIRIIKSYAREAFFAGQMNERGEQYKKTALKMAALEAVFSPVMALMVGMSVLLTVWYGGKLVIQGEIDHGNITEFIFYVYRLTWPFASLGWVTSLIQRAAASQKRINEFLDQQPQIINSGQNHTPINGSIRFQNVHFTYPENKVIALKNISFELKAGQTLGITGPVGSGKSSLLALISRQYDATRGNILIDDQNVREHDLYKLRKSTGVVPQDVFLFSDTIFQNIAFGSHDQVSAADANLAAQNAGVYNNIMGFPQQFETLVGERGVTLSGGQKQRISIARALIGQPRILLLDDCLSALDSETEALILANLKEVMQKKTSIIVSHRLSGIQQANLILYLKDGEIIEQGTHTELINKNGAYAQLWHLQNQN